MVVYLGAVGSYLERKYDTVVVQLLANLYSRVVGSFRTSLMLRLFISRSIGLQRWQEVSGWLYDADWSGLTKQLAARCITQHISVRSREAAVQSIKAAAVDGTAKWAAGTKSKCLRKRYVPSSTQTGLRS
jgi:hypothetical protein